MDPTAVSSTISSVIAAAAYDEAYRFGRRPTVRAPFPFTEREFARLLVTRGRIQADPSADDQLAAWVERSVNFVSTLPKKQTSPKKPPRKKA